MAQARSAPICFVERSRLASTLRSSQSFFSPAAERDRGPVTSDQNPAVCFLSALSATPSMAGRARPRAAPRGVAGALRAVSAA